MTADTWRQYRLRGLALVTVAATAWISFSSSQDLAVRAGFGLRSWAFPICLDAVAAFAVDIWMRRTAAQRPAATLALFAIGLSLASNVADHYLVAGTLLAALLGGIPPAMLAALLLVLHRHGQATSTPETPAPVELSAAVDDQPHLAVAEPEQVRSVAHELHQEILDNRPIKIPREPIPYPQVDQVSDDDLITTYPPLPPTGAPLPVNQPDSDPERTQIMPVIRDDEVPGKFDPTATGPAPAKVQPARRAAPEVSAEVDTPAYSAKSNDELIMIGVDRQLTSRRAVMSAFGVGTKRATDIARAVKEKING